MQITQFQKIIKAGQYLFKEGDTTRETYILLEGEVRVLKGNQHIADISSGGSFIGEMATLLGEPRTATIQTTKDSKFIVVGDDNIEALISKIPSMGVKLARTLALRLSVTTKELTQLKQQSSPMIFTNPGDANNALDSLIAQSQNMMAQFSSMTGTLDEMKVSESPESPKAFESSQTSDSPQELMTEASEMVDNKNYDGAIKNYEKVIAIMPENAQAYFNMGRILRIKKDIESAIANFKKVAQIEPEEARAFNELSKCYHDLKDLEQAIFMAKKAIDLDPEMVEALNNLGVFNYKLKNMPEAEKAWKRVLEIEPDNAKAKGFLAKI